MATNPPESLALLADRGSAAFALWLEPYLQQWSQYKYLELESAYLGGRYCHSSTLTGFLTRTLRKPSPQVFLAMGYLNLAHANSLGLTPVEEALDVGLPQKLPEGASHLWRHTYPLKDAEGTFLGPVGLFEGFCGLRQLSPPRRIIRTYEVQYAAAAIGKKLRARLMSLNLDWVEELPQLTEQCPLIGDVLLGRGVKVQALTDAIPQLAAVAQLDEEDLWDVVDDVRVG